jgi:preprotein translocase subunit SecE
MATPDMSEEQDIESQGEQEEDELALDESEDDEEEDEVQAVMPVGERGVSEATRATGVSRQPVADWLLPWIPRGYLRNSIAELLKVTWPSRQETINLTILVLAIAAGFAIVYGVLDILFFDGLQAIIQHVK